ncbi:MAG: hypothetical protein V3V09_02260 [Arenicellales bacterium]
MVKHSANAEAATLPFRLVETLGIACGYERSFKLSASDAQGNIQANRYLLGINTCDLETRALHKICREMQMPENLFQSFNAGLSEANLIFIGFEEGQRGPGMYKIYLEYWDKIQTRLQTIVAKDAQLLLHKGFKWAIDAPQKQVITEYHTLPKLGTDALKQRILTQYLNKANAQSIHAALKIIQQAALAVPKQCFIYVDVSEQGNQRQSFDVNLYPAQLLIKDIYPTLLEVSTALNIDMNLLERLMGIIRDKNLGHISAGTGRDGQPYFTVYYEY